MTLRKAALLLAPTASAALAIGTLVVSYHITELIEPGELRATARLAGALVWLAVVGIIQANWEEWSKE